MASPWETACSISTNPNLIGFRFPPDMKILHQLCFAVAACAGLSSCAVMYDGPMNEGFASAVTRNNLRGVMANVTPRNASVPIRGVPPMVYAASHGNEDMIDVLYNNGASLNVRNPRGQSLAYLAASNGHRSTASKLVALGSGSSSEVSRGSSEYQAEKAREAAAARKLASQRASVSKSGTSNRSDDERAVSWFFRTLEWNSTPTPWYQQMPPRPTY